MVRDNITAIAVFRHYGSAVTQRILAKTSDFIGTTSAGYGLTINGGGNYDGIISDGTTVVTETLTKTAGEFAVLIVRADFGANGDLSLNGTASTGDPATGITSVTNSLPLTIGAQSDISTYADMEFVGGAIYRKYLSDNEIDRVVQYFTL
jgi:hypothetical protein